MSRVDGTGGGQVATGSLFYGARFNDASVENSAWPMAEARVQIGLRKGSSVYGIALGYALVYPGLDRSLATPFLGGFLIGLFADRR
jgi:hypothetical protein